jgi:uncharacterized protein (UPF0264 family)
MQLLVSVTDAAEAAQALLGGADLIDAKDPVAGALGAVSLDSLRDICQRVAGARLVTAALGDATNETSTEHKAQAFATAGARFVKIGLAGISGETQVATLLAAAVRGASRAPEPGGVVAVAYADGLAGLGMSLKRFVTVAASAGADGVLLDTADKHGPCLLAHITPDAIGVCVADAHGAGLFVALAGKLTEHDLDLARDLGADIAGVRGAACEGGRLGRVTLERVGLLRTRLRNAHRPIPQFDMVGFDFKSARE